MGREAIRDPLTRLLAILVLAVSFTACGGSATPPREAKIPARLGADFAAQADSVVASLEAGEPCRAREQAVALQSDVTQAISAGRIPAKFRDELRSGVARLVSEIDCPPPAPPGPTASCEALERRKDELEEEKKAVKDELQDEDARKAREEELEVQKKAVEEQLKACKEAAHE